MFCDAIPVGQCLLPALRRNSAAARRSSRLRPGTRNRPQEAVGPSRRPRSQCATAGHLAPRSRLLRPAGGLHSTPRPAAYPVAMVRRRTRLAENEVDAWVQVAVAHGAPDGDLGPPLGRVCPGSSSVSCLRPWRARARLRVGVGKVSLRLTPRTSSPAPLSPLLEGEGRGVQGRGRGSATIVIQMASSASHIVPGPPQTWKRAAAGHWPAFSTKSRVPVGASGARVACGAAGCARIMPGARSATIEVHRA